MRRVTSPVVTTPSARSQTGLYPAMRRTADGTPTPASYAAFQRQQQMLQMQQQQQQQQQQQLQQQPWRRTSSANSRNGTPRGGRAITPGTSARGGAGAPGSSAYRTASPFGYDQQQYHQMAPPPPPPQQQQQQQQQTLRHDEIRRIVEKVEKHFTPQIEQLTALLAQQREETERLRAENESLLRQLQNSQRTSMSTARDEQHIAELRADLQREKRARFECEEQSHKMSEEHARYVQTMERRLRKAESIAAERDQARGGTPRSARTSAAQAASSSGVRAPPAATSSTAGPSSAGRSDPRSGGVIMTPNAQIGGLTAASPLGPTPSNIEDSTNFFEQVARQLDEINTREESRSAAIRSLL